MPRSLFTDMASNGETDMLDPASVILVERLLNHHEDIVYSVTVFAEGTSDSPRLTRVCGTWQRSTRQNKTLKVLCNGENIKTGNRLINVLPGPQTLFYSRHDPRAGTTPEQARPSNLRLYSVISRRRCV